MMMMKSFVLVLAASWKNKKNLILCTKSWTRKANGQTKVKIHTFNVRVISKVIHFNFKLVRYLND